MKQHITAYWFAIFTLAMNISMAQQNPCGQSLVTNHFFQQHPDWKQVAEAQWQLQPLEKNKNMREKSTPSDIDYWIPVVFHVLHENGSENISDTQFEDQIRILNRDYQKQNADTALVVSAFQDRIANVGIGFKLAKIDPNGNCTNGIIRHQTPKTNWDANNLNDFIYSWPREKYLNIYVVKSLNINATAYAFLPGTPIPPGADVIVTMHNMVGSIGTSTIATSRVLTHEFGHWLGLQHIWGTSNQPGVVCGNDLVDDTPETKGFISCQTGNNGICNPGIPENVQNYMDYAPCKIMFTTGQAERMLLFLTGTLNGRNQVFSEANLVATGIKDNNYVCTPKIDFMASQTRNCINSPFIFKNISQTGNISGTWEWQFPFGTPSFSTDSTPSVSYSLPGSYPVSLRFITGSGNFSETKSGYITIDGFNNPQTGPLSLDFEIPDDFNKLKVVNIDGNAVQWQASAEWGASGSQTCIWLPSYNSVDEIMGEKDAFELPDFDFSDWDTVRMAFSYAYARLSSAQRDSFKVQYSLDCGNSWTSIAGLPSTAQMASQSGGTTPDAFLPQPQHWARQNIPSFRLSALANQPKARIRFLFVKDIQEFQANNLFIDNIEIGPTLQTGNRKINHHGSSLSVVYEPEKIWITSNTDIENQLEIKDLLGRDMTPWMKKVAFNRWVIDTGAGLQNGIYFIRSIGENSPSFFPIWIG